MLVKLKRKLFVIAISILLTMTVFIGASYAWFTLSTHPEITGMKVTMYTKSTLLLSEDGETYDRFIDISEKFAGLATLKPVSTVDLENWFIPTYGPAGLNNAEDFILDDKLEYANVPIDGMTGTDLVEAMAKGYYVYGDFWMKTEESEGCTVRISIPNDPDSISDEEYSGGRYGSFVLPKLFKKSDSGNGGASGGAVYEDRSNNCYTSVRVGFLLYEQDDIETDADGNNTIKDGAEPVGYYIYEPNADMRSAAVKPDDVYVLGYDFDADTYTSAKYFETHPIGIVDKTTEKEPIIVDLGDDYILPLIPDITPIEGVTPDVTDDGNETTTTYTQSDGKKTVIKSKTESDGIIVKTVEKTVIVSTGKTTTVEKTVEPLKTTTITTEKKTNGVKKETVVVDEIKLISDGYEANTKTTTEKETVYTFEEQELDETRLAIQKGCTWDFLDQRQTGSTPYPTIYEKIEANNSLNSNDVIFGGFYDSAILYGNLRADNAPEYVELGSQLTGPTPGPTSGDNSNYVCELSVSQPLMVRMFVWIEGQDIDCWNDIATGNFTVNIEFAGQTNEQTNGNQSNN